MGAEQEVERQRRQSGEQESLLRAELSKQQRLFEERANVQQRDWEGQLDVANQKNKNLQKELEVSKKDQQEKSLKHLSRIALTQRVLEGTTQGWRARPMLQC